MSPRPLNFWQSCDRNLLSSARETLLEVVERDANQLVNRFYDTFLAHEKALPFLSHSVVHERLSHSLRKWLLTLMEIEPDGDLSDFNDRQRRTGEVHARIRLPMHLVLEGASLIKTDVSKALLAEYGNRQAATAIVLFNEVMDYAMLQMSEAYVSGAAQRAKVEEAYRLFTLGQDVGVERESQRAALMEWSQSVIFGLFGSAGSKPRIESISSSEFGLWFRHRASIMFQGSLMLKNIEKAMREIDDRLLPKIENRDAADGAEIAAVVARLQSLVEEIKFLLADLFQSLSASAGARDALTNALNRKFLPSILGREVSLCLQHGTPLSVLMIDVDHFKQINDRWGHPAGDQVLRQVAEIIIEHTRAADIVFRYGGEEFLVALVETDHDKAFEVAERVRAGFMNTDLNVADGTSIRGTISIGVATHRGHPDFQHLIDAADKALYLAKNGGRNQVIAA
ncbi:diguanylate cyclase [Neorhizobium petrolearium]|uniref:diguanylate cyclase n=1 Tax=Neorhizobium petrolearium TaxID=515361 RepID=UPI003F819BB0